MQAGREAEETGLPGDGLCEEGDEAGRLARTRSCEGPFMAGIKTGLYPTCRGL